MNLFQPLFAARSLGRWSLLTAALLIAACSNMPQQSEQRAQTTALSSAVPQTASTLGTQWGEGRESRVYSVPAQRVEPQRDKLQLAYSDERSIRQALGQKLDAQRSILLDQGKVELSVHDARDTPLTIYSSIGQNNYQLAGQAGERYVLVYTNRSATPYEIITTVDGLDVLSGKPGSRSHNGYMLQAGAVLRIEGFRKSAQEVAAFRFSGKDRAYAANSLAGDTRNIGVIGAMLYEVRPVKLSPPATPTANPFPGDASKEQYAPPPRY